MSTPFSQVDPFTQIYRALWAYAEAEPLLTSRVKAGNRIKSDGDNRHPDKRETNTADYPELALRPADSNSSITRSSHGAEVVQSFNWELQTGDQRATEQMFPIKWALLRAMKKAEVASLGLDFVTKVRLTQSTEAAERGGDVAGWLAVLRVEVAIRITTDELTS